MSIDPGEPVTVAASVAATPPLAPTAVRARSGRERLTLAIGSGPW